MSEKDDEETTHASSQTHGQVCYLQIPALDLMISAGFYEKVFGWQIERPSPSFEAPGLIGQWVLDRPPATDAGPLIWINVDSLNGVLDSVCDNGGEILKAPSVDGPRRLATIRDPAGNAIGIVQH